MSIPIFQPCLHKLYYKRPSEPDTPDCEDDEP